MIYGILVKTSGCAARPVTMSINHVIGGGGLGSESAGTMRYSSRSFVDFSRLPITESSRMTQHCGPTAAVAVVSRDPTFAPRTPATSRRVHLSLVCPRRGLVTGAYVQEGGKWPVPAPTTADRTEPAPCPPCQQTHTAFSLRRPGHDPLDGRDRDRRAVAAAASLPAAVSQSRWATPAT